MPDLEKLAEAYGVKGITVKESSQLAAAIAEMLAHDGPVLVNVYVTKDENCYPMVPPGKSNAQMVGLPTSQKSETAVEIINCNYCGAENLTTNKFCPQCGTKL
jgi:acetolactate synthase-1/2/3 large subunit